MYQATELRVGMSLPNTATVLAYNDNKLLALFNNNFVVWSYNKKDLSCYWGAYFKDIDRALEAFNFKIKE